MNLNSGCTLKISGQLLAADNHSIRLHAVEQLQSLVPVLAGFRLKPVAEVAHPLQLVTETHQYFVYLHTPHKS